MKMTTLRSGAIGMLILLAAASAGAVEDVPGAKDHPLFTRMLGYYLSSKVSYREIPFDSQVFYQKDGQKVTVEGKKFVLKYHFDRKSGAVRADYLIRTGDIPAARAIPRGCLVPGWARHYEPRRRASIIPNGLINLTYEFPLHILQLAQERILIKKYSSFSTGNKVDPLVKTIFSKS